ncbi:DUF1989 domain-containing protein [Nocardioides sp. BP30]|uniref:urea amidolyase associated protein UAAP1 n=1 Tax=Nocardioides sp. BP30 TaxID=3036374 RepID=UPI00246830D3|nr:urea amidolyase associated protein UAAP1 [Nocardioides sp. BP30]WGL50602.1 DUF1989 domain-containing protein [Nocardioides sp. BP30]
MSLYSHVIPGGAAWSAPLRAGRLVTLTALAAGANASMLLFNADRVDRLNIPDTLKAQMSARITPPMVLMSDRGLALASVVASSLDWHDCLGGFGSEGHLARFGASSYGADRNDWRRSARTGLVSELTKHGLDERDLHAPVNFFSKVAIADDARASMAFVAGHAAAGDTVTLRTEHDVLMVLCTAPHPLDPGVYAPASVEVSVDRAEPVVPAADASWGWREESARALEMSRRVLA